MNKYLYAIKMAGLFLPIVSIIFLIIYVIIKNKTKSRVSLKKAILIYTFICYLIIVYFLVILPLPSINAVKNYTSEYVQLKPFYALTYLNENQYFNISNLSALIKLVKNAYFYQFIYNIVLTIPFSIYLKKIFSCNFFEIIIYTFLLSLFLEITQLSGLYGLYPRPYRIFDVDDLITNTLGGIIGYIIANINVLIKRKF